jgi:hypothetical protein
MGFKAVTGSYLAFSEHGILITHSAMCTATAQAISQLNLGMRMGYQVLCQFKYNDLAKITLNNSVDFLH